MKLTPSILVKALIILVMAGCSKSPNIPVTSTVDSRKVQELEAQLQQLKLKSDASLSREKALMLLKQYRMKPVTRELCTSPCKVYLAPPNPSFNAPDALAPDIAFIKLAIQIGYFIDNGRSPDESSYELLSPSEAMKKYVLSYDRYGSTRMSVLNMAELTPFEVTGIEVPGNMNGKTISRVNFKILYIPTPLGELWNRACQPNFYSGWAPAVATFSLYDDGWRIEGWERTEH